MRPAQIAREIHALGQRVDLGRHASMRPAQIAREIHNVRVRYPQNHKASMRPAQIAREIRAKVVIGGRKHQGFNEARANCAGNCHPARRHLRRAGASMRPAQIAREINTLPASAAR